MEDEVGQFVIGKENLDGERKPARRSILQTPNIAAAFTCRCGARKLSFLEAFDAPAWRTTAPNAPFPPLPRRR